MATLGARDYAGGQLAIQAGAIERYGGNTKVTVRPLQTGPSLKLTAAP
jgi:hypothetical protein